MMRRFLGVVMLFLAVFFLVVPPPVRAATASSPSSSDCDEHPWDFLKHAYKVEVLTITPDYVVVAVWYTKEQVLPDIIRIDLQTDSVSGTKKTRAKNSFIFTE